MDDRRRKGKAHRGEPPKPRPGIKPRRGLRSKPRCRADRGRIPGWLSIAAFLVVEAVKVAVMIYTGLNR